MYITGANDKKVYRKVFWRAESVFSAVAGTFTDSPTGESNVENVTVSTVSGNSDRT